ncbi:MAG TPA: T9SS type A sorting domain-containing protein [Bacteroidia bacterium]|nr:T9SS type A sorting domain-containing protein [Bacteroidia bacterium]HRE24657.1 T9SS type A sorting domain-containing protein [Bacteroidia bacterium]
MKNIKIISIIVLLFVINNKVNSQNWQWANNAGGVSSDFGGFSCTDANGNIYVTGNIGVPSANFQTDTPIVNGINDIYFAKYDNGGNEIWVKHFGGSYNDQFNQKYEGARNPVFDPVSNCIYVTGSFIGSCTIGSFNLFASLGFSDREIFIAKFDLNGNCIWAKSAGSNGDDEVTSIYVNSNGDILISGTVKYPASFDTVSISNGGFIAKYNSAGNCFFAKIICNGITLFSGAAGAVHSINNYSNSLYLLIGKWADTLTIDTSTIIIPNNYSFVLAKFDLNGNIQSYKVCGGPNPEYGELSIDNSGNCYFVSRFFGGTAIFDTDTIHATGTTDFFFAKYDQNLNYQWVQQSHASNNARAIGCSSDANGNVYISGSFSGNATFGTFNITSITTEDMFIARYDNNGNCIGVRHEGQGIGYGVLTTQDGSCIVTGTYNGNITFGSIPTLTGYGGNDIFIAKSDAITGIGEERIANNELIIYANPNQGKCNVTVPDDFVNETNLILSIYDNTGKLIQQKTLEMNDGNIKLNLEQEAKGVYNITLANKKKSYSGKIVFE